MCKNHPDRKVKARELCNTCYEHYLHKINPAYHEAQRKNSREWRRKYPDRAKKHDKEKYQKRKLRDDLKELDRDSAYKRKYGISLEDYNRMYKEQNGCCAICGKFSTRRLAVDHNHKTGVVRGLLCTYCNFFLGTLENNLDVLDKSLIYAREGYTT